MNEIYTLAIQLESGPFAHGVWKRVIEIPEEMDLYDLHLFIQKLINFNNDHLFEFFVGRHWRHRSRVFVDFEETEGLETEEV